MRILNLSFVILLLVHLGASAQWLPSTGATEISFLYRSGNVGLGVTSTSAYKLNIKGDATNGPLGLIGGGASASESLLTVFAAPASAAAFNVAAMYGKTNGTNSNDSYFAIKAINKSGTGWMPGMTVYSGGNIGIGTLNPVSTLDVAGRNGNASDRNFRVTYPGGGDLLNAELAGLVHLGSLVGGNGWASLYAKQGSARMAAVFDGQVSFINGKVGIGHTGPAAFLDVGIVPEANLATVFGRHSEGNGTGAGTYLAMKTYSSQFTYDNGKSFSFEHSFYGMTNSSVNFYRGQSMTGGFLTFNTNDNTEKMRVTAGGNVGIGTRTPDAKLTVNGDIHAKEVRVDLNIPGPDYVFESDYELASLDDIKEYIQKNKHLPEVPSAKEMEQDGVRLLEMNMLLLKKVEELTLYLIEQEARIKELEANAAKLTEDGTGK